MTTTPTPERTDPPQDADELTTLCGFLDYFRDTLRVKAGGLDHAQLSQSLPPSDLTLGALVKHLAAVEDQWFGEMLWGLPEDEPWASADWAQDPDWEFTSAAQDSPEALWAQYELSVARSRERLAAALAELPGGSGADPCSIMGLATGDERGQFSLRWILVHLIEEYARHCGHADLIRQSVDGAIGD